MKAFNENYQLSELKLWWLLSAGLWYDDILKTKDELSLSHALISFHDLYGCDLNRPFPSCPLPHFPDFYENGRAGATHFCRNGFLL